MNREKAEWLKNSLEHLFTYLDDTYDINAGGCCFAAYVIAKNLESLGESYKLVIYDEDYLDNIDSVEIQENIVNRDIQRCPNGNHTCCHYAIKIKNLGIVNASDFKYEKRVYVDVTSYDILWIYEKGEWNCCYDPRLNDIVEQNINLVFNAYERVF